MSDFAVLINSIEHTHHSLQATAANAVNRALTIRNWLIGYYIVEYEQNGEDRANYGEKVIDTLASKLKHIKGLDRRSLFKLRQFYTLYHYLLPTIQHFIQENLETTSPKNGLLIVGTLTPLSENKLEVPGKVLLTKLSYSHLEELLKVEEPLK